MAHRLSGNPLSYFLRIYRNFATKFNSELYRIAELKGHCDNTSHVDIYFHIHDVTSINRTIWVQLASY